MQTTACGGDAASGGTEKTGDWGKMRNETAQNAMRSAVVVIGSMAFGYITLKLGLKPYLEEAQRYQQNNPDKSPDPTPESDEHQQFDSAAIIIDDGGRGGSTVDS